MPDFKMPKTPAACADKLKELEDAKKKAQKVADAIGSEHYAVEQHLIGLLEASGAKGVIGNRSKATLKEKEVPTLKDPEKFYAYVKKTGQFNLIQRRLANAAVRELWEDGKKVPGIDRFIHKFIGLTKA